MLTVITPAASQQLTTLAAVKTELKVSGTADDDWLSEVIDRASATIRRWCGRTFALETVRETFRLSALTETLSLSRWPVVSIVSVSETGNTLTSGDYETDDDVGFVYRLTGSDNRRHWPAGKIVVDYSAGYILPGAAGATLPEDVERATMLLVKAEWFARTRDPLVKSEGIDGVGTTTYWVGGAGDDAALPSDVAGLLTPHRLAVMG